MRFHAARVLQSERLVTHKGVGTCRRPDRPDTAHEGTRVASPLGRHVPTFFALHRKVVSVLNSSKWRHCVMRFHAVREGVARLEAGAVILRVYA